MPRLLLSEQFLRDADSVADRFRELSTHLDSLDLTVQENIKYQVDAINNYAEKLLAVNKQLGRKTESSQQSQPLWMSETSCYASFLMLRKLMS